MKSMDQACKQALNISAVQLSALMVLNERNGCLMKDLASALMLDKSALTSLARRMQEADLIERLSCESDSRAARLKITARGNRILNQGLALLRQANKDITRGFSEDELDTVSRFLSHLTVQFSKDADV